MAQATFETRAEATIVRLFERLEEALGDCLDIDLQGGILEIEAPDGQGTYVVNKHAASQEIWLSSPKSGAWHFRLDANGAWKATRGGADAPALSRILADELSQISGRTVALEE